jgi:hypothetical protein
VTRTGIAAVDELLRRRPLSIRYRTEVSFSIRSARSHRTMTES